MYVTLREQVLYKIGEEIMMYDINFQCDLINYCSLLRSQRLLNHIYKTTPMRFASTEKSLEMSKFICNVINIFCQKYSAIIKLKVV